MPLRKLTPDLARAWRDAGAWTDEPLYRVVDRHAERRPDHPAVADQHRSRTYGELVIDADKLARWLLDQGLSPGAVVAVQAPSCALLPIAHVACDRADLTFLPLPHTFRERELRHLLGLSDAEVVFAANDEGLAVARAMRAEGRGPRIAGTLDLPGGDAVLEELLGGATVEPVAQPTDPDAPRHAMISSGTTALSRVSLWSDNNLWFFLAQFRDAVEMSGDDVCVGLAPANGGSTGYVFPVLAPLYAGASSVLLEKWNPSEGLALLAGARATIATAIPTQIVQMLAEPSLHEHRFNLRVFNNAGAALAPEVAKEVESVLGCTIQSVYGASDGGVPVMTRTTDAPDQRYTTVGRLLPHTDFRLVDAELTDVAEGQPGEILFRNPTKTYGYLGDDERTDAVFVDDGYYRSGDLGVLVDGYLRIVGRVKDMIIRGGRNISPGEIEDLLVSHPGVAEVAVVGIPDPVYGERACACIVPRPGSAPALADVTDHLLGSGLEKFKLPELVELFDALPRNVGEKLAKPQLRDAVITRLAERSA